MKFEKYKKLSSLGVILFVLFLIFHNSMYPIQESDLQSGFVLRVLNRFFSDMGYDIVFTQYAVRKLAHFAEYFFFGLILTATLRSIRKNPRGALFFELFLFLAVPVLDETIQLAYRGRNSSIVDVLIDFAGCVAGMGLYRLILLIAHANEKHPQHLKKQGKSDKDKGNAR